MAKISLIEEGPNGMKGFLRNITQFEISKGAFKGQVPILYYDNTSVTAIFTASTNKVKKYLPHPSMKLIELLPGRCLVAFTAFEYRNTDIAPYNEFSIACLITFDKPQIPGITIIQQLLRRCFSVYVWHLPVTTEIARVGGVNLYGYPKFIADIQFHRRQGWIECSLSEKDKLIVKLSGRVLPTSEGKVMKYETYSIKNDTPLITKVCLNPLQYAQSMNRNDAALEIGTEHVICQELRSINLSKKPIIYQYIPANEAILFLGRNLME